MKKFLKGCICATAFLLIFAGQYCFASRADLVQRIEKSKDYLDDVNSEPDKGIPYSLLNDCKGIMILQQYNVGFVIGVKGGNGVILLKDPKTNRWGPPAFVTSGAGSIGAQIGGQKIDAIFLIMNKEGVDMLLQTKFTVGVDASAAAGPVGRDAAASVGPGTAILVYSRAKGLYAGATFTGGLLLNDDSANQEFYHNKHITAQDIIFRNRVKVPKEAESLIRELDRLSKP